MTSYYNFNNIKTRDVAMSDEENLSRSNVAFAFAQEIMDLEGIAFIPNDDVDAFLLTPILSANVFDQIQTQGDKWKSIQNVYIRQKITNQKSSFKNILVRMKNTSSTENITVNFEIRDKEFELLGTFTQTVGAGTPETEYILGFELHHLPIDDYYFIIKNTEGVAGVEVKYHDGELNYNRSMEESINGVDYQALNSDLWFKTQYANESSFDIKASDAIIFGEKVHPIDTHVIIEAPSEMGDRIDIVALNRDGEYEIIEGIVSTKPSAPIDNVEYGYLQIAHVTVYKSKPLAGDMDVEQGTLIEQNSLGIRLRSILIRLGFLEKEVAWMMEKNSPERIIYNLMSGFFDVGASTNITWDDDLGAYRLSDDLIKRKVWDLRGDIGFTSSDIDHTDHQNGNVKLRAATLVDCGTFSYHGDKRDVYESKNMVYKNSRRASHFPGAVFTIDDPVETLKKIIVDVRFYRDITGAAVYVFRQDGMFIEKSTWKGINQMTQQHVRVPEIPGAVVDRATSGIEFIFSGTKRLAKGNYYWVLVGTPESSSHPGYIWCNPWYSRTKSCTKYNNNFIVFSAYYPGIVKNGRGLLRQYKRPGRGINFTVVTTKSGYVSSGYVQSQPYLPGGNIASCKVDLNIDLPKGTSYKLEVSNNGGATFYRMTSDTYTFGSQQNSFVWKLTLYTSDISKTPRLYYDVNDGYSINFVLNLAAGSNLSGSLVTIPFDGSSIVESNVKVPSKFGHWKWLRWWAQENAGKISVDLEASTDGTKYTYIRSGIGLDEVDKDVVIYGQEVEDDEYNFPCEVDMQLFADSQIIDPCEVAWTKDDETNVTTTADTSIKQSGEASAKIAIGAGAVPGLMAHTVKNVSLRPYEQVDLYLRSSVNIAAGDFKLVIASDEACTTVLEEHDIPAVNSGAFGYVSIKLDDPDLLVDVKSIGLKLVNDIGAVDIYIDQLIAIKTNLVTLDSCTSGWVSNQGANVTITQTEYVRSAVGAGAVPGIVSYKPTNLNLTEFKQIRFLISSSQTLAAGDYQLVFASDAACTNIIEAADVGAVNATGTTVTMTFDIENPQNLNAVKAIGLKMIKDNAVLTNIDLDTIQGIKTLDVPFYQNYVRFRFNISRANASDLSPIVRKVGVIPQLV